MKRVTISHSQPSDKGKLDLTDEVIGITLVNIGAVAVKYSWNNTTRALRLNPGESIPFGGFENYTLGGNTLYYAFDGSGQLQINTFTAGAEIKMDDC